MTARPGIRVKVVARRQFVRLFPPFTPGSYLVWEASTFDGFTRKSRYWELAVAPVREHLTELFLEIDARINAKDGFVSVECPKCGGPAGVEELRSPGSIAWEIRCECCDFTDSDSA